MVGEGATSSWSPDGTRIVFGKVPFGAGLQILDLETDRLVDLVDSGKDPAWAPAEGRWIAFVEGDSSGANHTVCLVDPTGKNVRKVHQGFLPVWLADGETLFFYCDDDKKVKSVDASSEDLRVADVCDMPWSDCPTVSPDGEQIAYAVEGSLHILKRNASIESFTLTLPTTGSYIHSWSPDGKRIGLGSCYGDAEERGLWILDLEAKKYLKVARGPFAMPAWSPDGSRLSFDRRTSEAHEVWVIETSVLESLDRVTPPANKDPQPSVEQEKPAEGEPQSE